MSQEGTAIDNSNRTDGPNTNTATWQKATTSEAVETESDAGVGDLHAAGASVQEPPERDLPLDLTFEILKNRRRRTVLEYLRNESDTVTVGELAEHIAAIENDTTVQQLNAQQRKRVYIGLYQCHLPKLDDAYVVDFNDSRGLVTLTETAEPLYDYLDTAEELTSTTPPSRYFEFTVLAGVLFLIATAAGAPIVAALVLFSYLVLFLGSVYQSYREENTS